MRLTILIVALLLTSYSAQAQLARYYDADYCAALSAAQIQQMKKNPFLVHIKVDRNGAWKDTLVHRLSLHGKGPMGKYLKQHPNEVVMLSSTGFQISDAQEHGVSLHAGSQQHFLPGDTVCFGFIKHRSTGVFIQDYTETMMGNYVNHSDNPSTECVLTPEGIALIAKKAIPSGKEVTASYKQLLDILNHERTAVQVIKFW